MKRRIRIAAASVMVAAGLIAGLLSPASAPAAVVGEPPADDPAAWLFDPAAVVEIDLTLPQESIDALNSDPGEYQDGTFSLTTPSEHMDPSPSVYA
jgi:hypothetical protein